MMEDEGETNSCHEDGDIFTKSLALDKLNLQNFTLKPITTEERMKKISDISAIYAFNIQRRRVLRAGRFVTSPAILLQVSLERRERERLDEMKNLFMETRARKTWKNMFCPCWYI